MKLLRILLAAALAAGLCLLFTGRDHGPMDPVAGAGCAACHAEYPPDWTPAVLPPDHGLVRAVAVEEDRAADDPGTREAWEWLRLRDPLTGLVPLGMRRREVAHARPGDRPGRSDRRGAIGPRLVRRPLAQRGRRADPGSVWTNVLGDPDSLQTVSDMIVTSAGGAGRRRPTAHPSGNVPAPIDAAPAPQ